MKKRLNITVFITITLILTGSYNGIAETPTIKQEDSIYSEIICQIPLGDKGIHYEGADNPGYLTWGPSTLAIAPDGTFWIADTPDDHLLQFDLHGVLIRKIAIGGLIIGAGDLEVTSSNIWVLDVASIPPKIVLLSLNGFLISSYDLPEGLWLENGLSGITQGTDGSILVEKLGGHVITQIISPSGDLDIKTLGGYDLNGNELSAYPADMRKIDASKGYLLVGENRIDVTVMNDLAGLSILRINPDGSFFVKVVESVLNQSFQVDLKVYHYNASGNMIGMARVPLADQYTSVDHGIAIGIDDTVYALVTRRDGAEIRRLVFVDELAPILSQVEVNEKDQLEDVSIRLDYCRNRGAIIAVADEYLNNSTYLNLYHIEDNGACEGRVKPSYLDSAGMYASVPYAWNLWDTVDQFNTFMSGGVNGYFAGNASNIYLSCGRGIDCSGLVSRAWGLGSHLGTCSLEWESISTQLSNVYDLQSGDIMNLCDPEGIGHAIIFDSFGEGGMWGYEATTSSDYDRVVLTFREFNTILGYTPRQYKYVCNTIHLPYIRKYEVEIGSDNQVLNPYPPSDSVLSKTPQPTPYP